MNCIFDIISTILATFIKPFMLKSDITIYQKPFSKKESRGLSTSIERQNANEFGSSIEHHSRVVHSGSFNEFLFF